MEQLGLWCVLLQAFLPIGQTHVEEKFVLNMSTACSRCRRHDLKSFGKQVF